jgi:hypothetical protein
MALSRKQVEFYNEFITGRHTEMMYGGAVGGGKTYLILGIFNELCRKYPGVRLGVVRGTFPNLRGNTVPSYKKLMSDYGITDVHLTKSEPFIATYPNGSTIEFIAVNEQKDKDHDKLKGLELTMVAIDEANEISHAAYVVLITRTGRWRNAEYGLPPIKICTCNPANNWVKQYFYTPWKEEGLPEGRFYLPALPHDNPFLSEDYLAQLESLTGGAYQRYVLGNWDFAEELNQLVSMEDLEGYFGGYDGVWRAPRFMGIDVSRHGADKSIIYYADDRGLLFYEEYKFDDLVKLKDIVKERMDEYSVREDCVGADAIGIGWGLIDLLKQDGIHIYPYQGSEQATPREQCLLPEVLYDAMEQRRRTEANFLLQQHIRETTGMQFSKGLKEQALLVKYAMDKADKFVRIETKLEQRGRLGYSLDIWDAAVICNYMRVYNVSDALGNAFSALTAWASAERAELRRECGTNHRKYSTLVKSMIY